MSAIDSYEYLQFAMAALAVLAGHTLVVGAPGTLGQSSSLVAKDGRVVVTISRREASAFGHGVHYWAAD